MLPQPVPTDISWPHAVQNLRWLTTGVPQVGHGRVKGSLRVWLAGRAWVERWRSPVSGAWQSRHSVWMPMLVAPQRGQIDLCEWFIRYHPGSISVNTLRIAQKFNNLEQNACKTDEDGDRLFDLSDFLLDSGHGRSSLRRIDGKIEYCHNPIITYEQVI
jgi:hypothetical protein